MKKRLTITAIICAALLAVSAVTAVCLKHRAEQSDLTTAFFNGNELSLPPQNGEVTEVIWSASFGDTVRVSPGEELKINVVAAAGAEVKIKMGTVFFDAEQSDDNTQGYGEYSVTVTFPKSKIEIDSIGKLIITAKYRGEAYSKEGAAVEYKAPAETASSSEQNNQTTDSNNIGNYIEPSEPLTAIRPNNGSVNVEGGQLCVVTSVFADTWSYDASDDNFIPYYTPLANGTVDYVTGQCQIYDEEEEKLRDFYILASGRKVETQYVQLLSNSSMGDNSIQVLSSSNNNGNLEIKLKTSWNVPYDFSFSPQNYYTAHNKKYNVSSFTAQQIQFTFYYTTSVSGEVNVGTSDVVSKAGWSVDSGNKTVSLTMKLREEGKYYGYTLKREADGTLAITVKSKPKALAGSVIVLDPGHGGNDSGALGFSGSVYESQINFALAVATMNELQKRGATVYLTRTDNVRAELEERKNIARQYNPDLFVSIHCNASPDTSKFGTSVYYFRPMSQPLASAVYTQLLSVFQNDFYQNDSYRKEKAAIGTLYNPFSVTRLEECPSILIETGFVSNNTECALFFDSGNRDKIAAAISNGIQQYIGA